MRRFDLRTRAEELSRMGRFMVSGTGVLVRQTPTYGVWLLRVGLTIAVSLPHVAHKLLRAAGIGYFRDSATGRDIDITPLVTAVGAVLAVGAMGASPFAMTTEAYVALGAFAYSGAQWELRRIRAVHAAKQRFRMPGADRSRSERSGVGL